MLIFDRWVGRAMSLLSRLRGRRRRMKGRVSTKLERVLRSRSAREDLRKSLRSGRGGSVTVGEKTYTVKTEVRDKDS